ncbi:MAG: copper resistance protein B [Gammaproteobacteria bacterium]
MNKYSARKYVSIGLVLALGSMRVAAAESPTMDHALMDDDPIIGSVLVDELEWQDTSPADAMAWDVSAWIGRDKGRVLLRSEGESVNGDIEGLRAELLWWRPVATWWNVVGGLRQDAGTGPGRTYGLIGIEGLAPYWFHVEADLFGGERGQFGTRIESSYEVRLTNRLILTPRMELQAFSRDDEATGIGSGLSKLEAGLRLRYEIRREFAPYIGIEWTGSLGDTADMARTADEPVRDTHLVAGLRFWF